MRAWPVLLLGLVVGGVATADNGPKGAPSAPADAKAEAKAHAAAGTKFFNIQDYPKAADEYRQAYLLDPDPNYLYATAQAERLGGDCEKALLSYKAYLRAQPSQAEKAQKNIDRCEQDLKDRAKPPEGSITGGTGIAAPVIVPTMGEQKVVIKETHSDPWTSDTAGHLLVGGGVVAAGVGVVLYLGGRSTISSNNSATSYDQFASGRSGLDSAKVKQTAGVSAIAVGGGLILGGVIHYVFHTRSYTEERVSAIVHPGEASFAYTGSF